MGLRIHKHFLQLSYKTSTHTKKRCLGYNNKLYLMVRLQLLEIWEEWSTSSLTYSGSTYQGPILGLNWFISKLFILDRIMCKNTKYLKKQLHKKSVYIDVKWMSFPKFSAWNNLWWVDMPLKNNQPVNHVLNLTFVFLI